MRHRTIATLVSCLLLFPLAPPAAVAEDDSRTFVWHTRFSGLVASAAWSTCPTEPARGTVCTDTILFGFNARTRDNKVKDRGPTVRTLTFVYRVVGGDIGAAPIAEWFTRTNDAVVTYRPRLQQAHARSNGDVLICTVFDDAAGYQCPASVPVDVTWRGTGELERIDEHNVWRDQFRLENTWTRGWHRTATASGTVGDADLGTLLAADLTRADQGEIVVQH